MSMPAAAAVHLAYYDSAFNCKTLYQIEKRKLALRQIIFFSVPMVHFGVPVDGKVGAHLGDILSFQMP